MSELNVPHDVAYGDSLHLLDSSSVSHNLSKEADTSKGHPKGLVGVFGVELGLAVSTGSRFVVL